MSQPLLSVDISVRYPKKTILDSVQLEIGAGEIVGLVGQSGSGKSTLSLAIMRLLGGRGATISGAIRFRGDNLLDMSESQMRAIRGRDIGLALQSASAALNPALRIETHLREIWKAHRAKAPNQQDLSDILQSVELPGDEAFLRRYPRQISIGQAQRVVIGMAILHNPALLIVDEPTSALDPITQAQLLRLFRSLSMSYSMSVLYISHDLLSVAELCNRMYVLHNGSVVESGPVDDLFTAPRHPYTQALVQSVPNAAALDFRRSLDPPFRAAGFTAKDRSSEDLAAVLRRSVISKTQ